MSHVVLSHIQTESILEARQAGHASVAVSLDLGLSTDPFESFKLFQQEIVQELERG